MQESESLTRRDALAWLAAALRTESHHLVRWPDTLWQQLENRLRLGAGTPARLRDAAEAERGRRERDGRAWFALDAPPKGIDDSSLAVVLSPRGILSNLDWARVTLTVLACESRGDLVATGANDGSISVLRARDLVEVAGDLAHQGAVTAVRWMADGTRIVSAGLDGTVHVLDAATLSKILTVETGQGRVYSAAAGAARFATAGTDGSVIVWDGLTGERVVVIQVGAPPQGYENAVAMSRDGERLATCTSGGQLGVWSVADGQPLATADAGNLGARACLFARDEQMVAVCGTEGKVITWAWSSSGALATIATADRPLWCLSYDPESDHLVFSGEDGVVRARALSGEGKTARISAHASHVMSCSVGAHAVVFTGGDQGVIRRSRLVAGDASAALGIGHDKAVTCCGMTADATMTATGEGSAMKSRVFGGADAIRRHDRVEVRVWAAGGALAGRVTDQRIGVTGCCFAADGSSLVVTDDTGCLTVWSPTEKVRVLEARMSLGSVACPTLSADGRWLAVLGAHLFVQIHDLQAPALDLSEHGAVAKLFVRNVDYLACAFGPGQPVLACAGRDGHVELWSPPWKAPDLRSPASKAAAATCIAWSPDGSVLVCGTVDGALVAYDTRTLTPVSRIDAHGETVTSCAFSAGGDILFSSSDDGCARAWRWPGGSPITRLPTQGSATCVAAAGEASGCVGDESGAVYLFRLVNGSR